MTEADFLRSLAVNPDKLTLSAFADWLEEQGYIGDRPLATPTIRKEHKTAWSPAAWNSQCARGYIRDWGEQFREPADLSHLAASDLEYTYKIDVWEQSYYLLERRREQEALRKRVEADDKENRAVL